MLLVLYLWINLATQSLRWSGLTSVWKWIFPVNFSSLYIWIWSNAFSQTLFRVYHYISLSRFISSFINYVRGALGIRGVRAKYADIRRCTLCYTLRPHLIFQHVQRMRTYRTYVIHKLTCTIHTLYAGNARHTLVIRFIR